MDRGELLSAVWIVELHEPCPGGDDEKTAPKGSQQQNIESDSTLYAILGIYANPYECSSSLVRRVQMPCAKHCKRRAGMH